MRIFDFVVQTIILLVALFALTTGNEAIVWIGLLQFFMGCWQLVSAIGTTIKYRKDGGIRKKMIKIYWLLVIIYFVGLGGGFLAVEAVSAGEMFIYVWFFAAWLIAIYYYVATIKMMIDNNKDNKTFLDVVN